MKRLYFPDGTNGLCPLDQFYTSRIFRFQILFYFGSPFVRYALLVFSCILLISAIAAVHYLTNPPEIVLGVMSLFFGVYFLILYRKHRIKNFKTLRQIAPIFFEKTKR